MVVLNKPVYSSYYYVNGRLPEEVIKNIDVATSDYPTGYDRTDKFVEGKWDGKIHLFNKSSSGYYYFPLGIIKDVTEILDSYSVEYTVKNDKYDFPPLNSSWNEEFVLRPYQTDCLLSLMKSGSGVLSLPTGSGKTLVSLHYAHVRNSPFIVLVHRQELLYQWEEEIQKLLGINPTLIEEDKGDFKGSKSCIAMIQTLWSRIKREGLKKINGFPLCILDECHIIPSQTAYKVAMRCDSYWRVGLSATPTREDNQQIKIFGATGRIVKEISVPDLIDNGYVAKPTFTIIRPNSSSFKSGDPFAQVYRKGIVLNEDRNSAIVKYANKLSSEGRSIYIHVIQISHGKNLSKKIPNSRFVSSKTPTRRQDINDFKEGKYPVLVSTLLKEGVDIPSMDAIIFAAGYKSSVLVIQTVGRALRSKKGKSDAIIVDLFDHGHRFMESHSQSRINTYAITYGKYFKPKYVRSGDI